MICHSEFISESNDSNDLATLEIPKQVRDDNCDTVSSLAGRVLFVLIYGYIYLTLKETYS
jgi:hypothetical protein